MDNATIHSANYEGINWRAYRIFAIELLQWLLKIAFWSSMHGVLVIIAMTFTTPERQAINENTITGTAKYGDDFGCGILTWNIYMQCFYIVWNIFQLALVFMCVRNVRKDSLGMSGELLIVQVCSFFII